MKNLKKTLFSVCLTLATTALYAPTEQESALIGTFLKQLPSEIAVGYGKMGENFLEKREKGHTEWGVKRLSKKNNSAEELQSIGAQSAQFLLEGLKERRPGDQNLERFYNGPFKDISIENRQRMEDLLQAMTFYDKNPDAKMDFVDLNLIEGALPVLQKEKKVFERLDKSSKGTTIYPAMPVDENYGKE